MLAPAPRGRGAPRQAKDCAIPGLHPVQHVTVDLFTAEQLHESLRSVLVHPKLLTLMILLLLMQELTLLLLLSEPAC